ncbi:MAG: hypothetical protein ACO3PD_04525 [Acidimicrobiales bacterium]
MKVRQQVLYLWGSGSSLDSTVVAWAFHDGAAGLGPDLRDGDPPYETGTEALRDGWFLLHSAQLIAPPPGFEHTNSYLEHEFVFERRVEV